MSYPQGTALIVQYQFDAQSDGELAVVANERVVLLEPEDPQNPGWIFVTNSSQQQGYIPSGFVSPEPQAAPLPQVASTGSFRGAQTGIPPPAAMGAPPAAMAAPPAAMAAPPAAMGAPPAAMGAPPAAMGAPLAADTFQPQPPNPFDMNGLSASIPAAAAPPQPAAASGPPASTLEYWVQRDSVLGPCRLPMPSLRRWYYRDIFDDIQGPFNPQEMSDRYVRKHINENTKILIEVGSGAFSKLEEKPLSQLYPTPGTAFKQAPNLPGGSLFWYYLDDNSREQGPFSAEQMKAWLDDGMFCSTSKLRTGDGSTAFQDLKMTFMDPTLAFVSDPVFGGVSVVASGGEAQAPEQPRPQMVTYGSVSALAGVGLAGQSSGRALLKQALDEPAAADAAAAAAAAAVPAAMAADPDAEEKEFMPVGMANEEPANSSDADKKKVAKVAKVYGMGWKGYKGFPSPGQKKYSQELYVLLTRPLNPDAARLKFTIKREIDGSHLNFNKYTLYHEKSKKELVPVISAFRHHHTFNNYYDIKMNTSGKLSDAAKGLTIANLEVNFMGTEFLLHNNVSGHQGKPKDLACVTYEKNRIQNKGPRKMQVGIPGIQDNDKEFFTWGHKGQKSPMLSSLKSLNVKNMLLLINKPPKYNPKKKAYMLDFKGRVTRASVKNFQLVDTLNDSHHDNVLMQHGRVGANKFTMDVQHPLSVLQAFAICLSSLHSKKGVD